MLLASATMMAPGAFAQEAPAAGGDNSEIVVTGSRIIANGFQQPTPVTVVGEQELARQMPVTIANYLNQLPSFGSTTSARNPGVGVAGGGAETLNLRNLGVTRTLVLLDNRRTVESSQGGGVDTVTLPTALIKRVEVVTGGASAAWGADAVAGVVNFVLDHDYEGLGVNLEGGITGHGDSEWAKVTVTGGAKFADGRGRIVANVDYSVTPEGVDLKDRSWFKSRAVVNNPNYTPTNGQPRQITVDGAGIANVSKGGVITAGPLRGIQFVGPSGTPVPYDFGNQSGLLQWGGDTENSNGYARAISVALRYVNTFAHVDYDVTDNVTAFVEGSYGHSVYKENGYLYYFRQGNLTINADNAFLDPGIRDRMQALNLSSFTMGRNWVEPGPPTSYNERNLWRAVVGLNGTIGDNWKWNAYYTHGDAKSNIVANHDTKIANFLSAVDAVRDPATGTVVCRSTLTNPGNGCVPLNVFGEGVASQAAIDYILGTAWQRTDVRLDVVSADATGTVFSLPAGDVSVAFGADYTRNAASTTQNQEAVDRLFAVQNFQPFSGKRSLKEAFVETNIPLLKDLSFVKQLELNAAARVTDYSTSGRVTTWKVGVSWQVTDDLRLRATRSRDIRAPTLTDLFSGGTFTQQVVFDPFTNTSPGQYTNAQGNPDLKPEDADTWTAGIVYSPPMIPGLTLSVDYYKISISGAIASVSAPLTLQNCFNGQEIYCPSIHRDPVTGVIVQIDTKPMNVASQVTQGWDFEVGYRHPLFGGDISLRALATYVPQFDQTDVNGVTRKLAGAIGDLNGSQPRLKANFNLTYAQGPLAVTLNGRLIGSAKLDNAWVAGVDVDDNSVPAWMTLGLTAVYKFAVRNTPLELTVGIDNLLDTDPIQVPVVPSTVAYQAPGMGGRFDLYDPLGRSFRVGLRAKF